MSFIYSYHGKWQNCDSHQLFLLPFHKPDFKQHIFGILIQQYTEYEQPEKNVGSKVTLFAFAKVILLVGKKRFDSIKEKS